MSAVDLEQLRALTSMDRPAVLESVGARAGDVEDGYSYQSMRGLSVLRLPDRFGSRVFFSGDAVVVVAVSEPPIAPDEIRSLMGDDIVELRSRQGKRAMIELDAGSGVAFSRDADDVGFVELFPPTTADDYRERIWFEPPAFTK